MATTSRKNHYLTPRWRAALAAASVLLLAIPALPIAIRGTIEADPAAFLCVTAFALVGTTLGLVEAFSSRVVTSPQGVEWHSVLCNSATPWSNVSHVETNPFGFTNLLLHETVTTWIPPLSWFFKLSGYNRLIQLTPYVADWRNSDLVKDILAHVPGAFDIQTPPPEL